MKIAYWALAVLLLYFSLAPIAGAALYGVLPFVSWAELGSMLARSLPYLARSLFIACVVTAASTFVGACAALALRRFDFPGRRLLRLAAALPLASPPFVGSLSFIMLFGKHGLITHGLLGLSVSPFGWQGIAALEITSFSALAYLVLSAGIDKIDTMQEDAARTLGAGEREIFFGVTLRSMAPELSAAAILVFLGSMADFGTPLIIGGSYRTLASDLYIQITGLYDMRSAAVSGLLLLVPCLIAFAYQRWRIPSRAYYAVGSASPDVRYRFFDPSIRAVLIGVAALYALLVAVQLGFILVGACVAQWGRDYTPTLAHFRAALSGDLSPFINSVALAFISALLASFLGVLLAYLVKRKRYPLRRAVDLAATLPAAVPGILFGIGYLVVFKYPLLGIGRLYLRSVPAPVLLGTGAIIYFLCVFRYMNVGLRSGAALLEHIDPDLEDAARNLGQKDVSLFADILWPLLTPAFRAAFLKTFATTMTTLGAIIFLILPSNKVAVQQLFQMITGSGIGAAAALGVLLSAFTLALPAAFKGAAAMAAERMRR